MASDRSVQQSGNEGSILQPGFRFAPNDEELLCFYLTKKVEDNNVAFDFIGEVDFNKCEPWHLLAWAKTRLMGETVFYFFSKLEKCGTGTRNKRTTEAGYWKITGEDRDVKTRCTGMLVGKKRTLAFYEGQAPKGERTGWTMCEYRIEGESTVAHHQDWVVFKFFDKPREKLLRGPPRDRSSPSGRECLPPSPNKNSNAGPNPSDPQGLDPSDPQGSYHGSGQQKRRSTSTPTQQIGCNGGSEKKVFLHMTSDLFVQQGGNEGSLLQPGFRFQPTDEELVRFYLMQKIENNNVAFEFIGRVDFNKCEPWDLWEWAKTDEMMFYFFSMLENKFNKGKRKNRATEAGYWKLTGQVMCAGMLARKKTLVFYLDRAPKGEKTGWTMYEYSIEGKSTVAHEQDWIICKVYGKPGDKLRPDPTVSRSSPSGPKDLLPSPSDNTNAGLNPSYPQGGYHDSGHESGDSTLLHSKGSDGWVTPRDSSFDFDGVLQKQHELDFGDGGVYRMHMFPNLHCSSNARSAPSSRFHELSSSDFISETDLHPFELYGSDHGATHSGHEGHDPQDRGLQWFFGSDGPPHRLAGRGKDKAVRDSQTLPSLIEVLPSPNVACDTGPDQSDSQESCHEAIISGQESHSSPLHGTNSTLMRSKGSDGWVTVSDRQGVMAGPPSENLESDDEQPWCLFDVLPRFSWGYVYTGSALEALNGDLQNQDKWENPMSEEPNLDEWEIFENLADEHWWGTSGDSSVGHFLVIAWRWTWFKLGRCMCVSVD